MILQLTTTSQSRSDTYKSSLQVVSHLGAGVIRSSNWQQFPSWHLTTTSQARSDTNKRCVWVIQKARQLNSRCAFDRKRKRFAPYRNIYDLEENFLSSTLCKQGPSRRRVPLGMTISTSFSSLKV